MALQGPPTRDRIDALEQTIHVCLSVADDTELTPTARLVAVRSLLKSALGLDPGVPRYDADELLRTYAR